MFAGENNGLGEPQAIPLGDFNDYAAHPRPAEASSGNAVMQASASASPACALDPSP